MDFNDYQIKALRTAGDLDKNLLLTNGLMGLNGEAGECIDILKKHLFQGHGLNKEKLINELGDVLWYIAISASALDIPLSKIAKLNVKKLEARYPDGFSSEKSIHRKED